MNRSSARVGFAAALAKLEEGLPGDALGELTRDLPEDPQVPHELARGPALVDEFAAVDRIVAVRRGL